MSSPASRTSEARSRYPIPTVSHPTVTPLQILTYKGDHNTLGYWYEWIKYGDRFDKAEGRETVHCGDSIPIAWKKPGANLNVLGYLDNKTEKVP